MRAEGQMTSNSDDLQQLRRELEWRREFDAELEREKREERRAQVADRWAELRDRWLRGIGYPTRILIYFVVMGLWFAGWYVLPLENLSDRPLASLTVGELGKNIALLILYCGGGMMLVRAFFGESDGGLEYVDWEWWGKFGLGLLAVTVVTGVWLAAQ
jgi:hypothetical protein